MKFRLRKLFFLTGAAGLAAVLLWGMKELPPFGRYQGPYGDVINANGIPERHATNLVTAVVFDYRGLDTMGEEFILFAAVAAVALLLRAQRGEKEPLDEAEAIRAHMGKSSDAVRFLGRLFFAITALFGLYVVLHAHLTPGGGFQGGVLVAASVMYIYLGGEYITFRKTEPVILLDVAEALGAGSYVIIGLAALMAGGAFLENLLPLGKPGEFLSSGSILLLNLAIGLEVSAGFLLLLFEFVEQTLMVKRRGPQ